MLKKRQPQNQARHNIKLAALTLVLLFLFLGFAKLHQFVNFLNSPLELSFKASSADGRFTQNFAIIALSQTNQEVGFLSLNSKNKKISFLSVPNSSYVDVPKGFGSWPVGSVFELGQQEKGPFGLALVSMSLSRLTGLPVDGVFLFSDFSEDQKLSDILMAAGKNPIKAFSFIRSIKTSLTPFELIGFLSVLNQVKGDDFRTLDLEKSSVTESKLLADGSRVLGVDNISLDLFIREKLADPVISEEGVPVAVINATPHTGLAGEVSRVLTNMGGNVIQVMASDQYESGSKVVTSDHNLTYIRVSQIFAPACLKKKCESSDPKVLSSRAKINIILGEDYFSKWYKK